MATLGELKRTVEGLIEDQGENAPVAYWVYTKEDLEYEIESMEDHLGVQIELSDEQVQDALDGVYNCDYIHQQIQETLGDEFRDVMNQ